MKKFVLTFVLLIVSALGAQSPASNSAPQAQLRLRQQLSVERWFIGRWICEGVQHATPTGPEVNFIDRFSFRMALGGSWLTYHVDQAEGPMKGQRTLIGWVTWDGNAKVHVRRDMNIGGSRVDLTTPGWDGDKLVFTGYMIVGDEKLPVKQTFTKKGDRAYDSALEVTGADGKREQWEQESCRKVAK